MDNELKDKWIAALESGQYKQAKKKLRDVEYTYDEWQGSAEVVSVGYCCLGVLAVVCNIPFDEEGYLVDDTGSRLDETEGDVLLPHSVLEEVGLNGVDMHTLARINDESIDFTRVVRYIKERL